MGAEVRSQARLGLTPSCPFVLHLLKTISMAAFPLGTVKEYKPFRKTLRVSFIHLLNLHRLFIQRLSVLKCEIPEEDFMWRMAIGHSSRLLTSLLTLAYLPYHFCQLFRNGQYHSKNDLPFTSSRNTWCRIIELQMQNETG